MRLAEDPYINQTLERAFLFMSGAIRAKDQVTSETFLQMAIYCFGLVLLAHGWKE